MSDAFAPDGVLSIGEMPKEEALERLALIDEKAALEFEHEDPPYKHSSHVFGFISSSQSTADSLTIQHVGTLKPDTSLKGSRINVSLNILSVAKYPGGGTHEILFEFTAENQIVGAAEAVHFNARHRVNDGGIAGLINAPIFIGLVVGNNMMRFKCRTVNVSSDNDKRFLSFLDSDILKQGLKLASTVQPAVAPLSAMVTGITKSVLATRQNLTVQNIDMGLDFGGSHAGARLALGDYVIVQVPAEELATWDWANWVFRPNNGQIVSAAEPGTRLPYNYLVFGISKYHA